jgi:hypothetical protein
MFAVLSQMEAMAFQTYWMMNFNVVRPEVSLHYIDR